MTSENLAICFSLNIFKKKKNEKTDPTQEIQEMMKEQPILTDLTNLIIKNQNYLFKRIIKTELEIDSNKKENENNNIMEKEKSIIQMNEKKEKKKTIIQINENIKEKKKSIIQMNQKTNENKLPEIDNDIRIEEYFLLSKKYYKKYLKHEKSGNKMKSLIYLKKFIQ
jgi:hypothetical protein